MFGASRILHTIAATLVVAFAACADPVSGPTGTAPSSNIFLTTVVDMSSMTPNARGLVLTRDGAIVRQFDSIIFEVRPRGGMMVYRRVRDNTLWASRTDGSMPQQLAVDSFLTLGQFAVLSPDGTLLASVDTDTSTARRGDGVIIVQRTDGTGTQVLAHGASSASNIAFSPDGSRIAYPGIDSELYTISVTGGQPRALGRVASGFDSAWATMNEMTPEWSPDGSRVLVNTISFGLALYPSDGSDAGREPDLAGISFGIRGVSTWSPDAQLIATADQRAVLLFDSDLNLVKRLDNVAVRNAAMLQWSPDSRSILFVEFDQSLTGFARILDVDTGTIHTIAERSFYAFWEH